jgi:micrococcal nuclease
MARDILIAKMSSVKTAMYKFEPFYRVKIESVIDGDTLVLSFYLGLGIWLNNQKVRLRGINAPEMRGVERDLGAKVTNYLKKLLQQAEDVIVKTDEKSKGKYGRFLVIVYGKYDGKWVNLNNKLVEAGAAVEYMASDASDADEIFDPPPEDIESRVDVNEELTEQEVYREVEAMMQLAREVIGES